MSILTIDIGGTSVKSAVWLENKLENYQKNLTPKSWEGMKQLFHSLLMDCLKENFTISGVAISSPGAVDSERGIIGGASAVPYIHDFNIVEELQSLFGLPVVIENDANCAAYAELWLGNAKGVSDFLMVVLGTGVGGSVIINREIIKGKHLLGGEFGYMVLDKGQTFSNLATTVELEKRYAKKMNLSETISAEKIFERAIVGDEVAYEEVEIFYYYLALGLYNLQYCFDPDKIILAGGVSQKKDLIDQIKRQFEVIKQQVAIAQVFPELEIAAFKNEANLIGAVYHFLENRGSSEKEVGK